MEFNWTDKIAPGPGERWETVYPVLNLHLPDDIYVFASVVEEDENAWVWVVRIMPDSDHQFEYVRAHSPTGFPEEEAKRRAEAAIEKLLEVAKLGLGGAEGDF